MHQMGAITNQQGSEKAKAGLGMGLLVLLVFLFLGRVLFPASGEVLGGHDIRSQFWPWFTLVQRALHEGHLPLWDPYQFSGHPFFSDPQVELFYPPAWLIVWLPVNTGISLYSALHLCLAGVGMLFFVRSMGANWLGTALSTITFTFSGFMAARIESGHLALLAAIAWLPWILLACRWSVRRGDIRSAIVAGVPCGMAILAGSPPSMLYIGLIWLAFVGYLSVTEQSWKVSIRQMLISGGIGLALSGVLLVPFSQLAALSTRAGGVSEESALRWSFPPSQLITLIIPTYFGDPVKAGYWGAEYFGELMYYVGALPLIAAALSLARPSRLTWLYIGLMVFGLLAALGEYGFLYRILYALLPPFRLVRVPARNAFLFVFGASALLGETISGWERLPDADRRKTLNRLMRWFLPGIVLVGVVGLAITAAALAASLPAESQRRLLYQMGGWAWALVAFLGSGVLLWSYLGVASERRKPRIALAIGLVVLCVIDLWSFGSRLLWLAPPVAAARWDEVKDVTGETLQRFLPWKTGVLIENGASLVGLSSVQGYDPLEMASYHDFVSTETDPRSVVYDILGVEYVLAGAPLETAFTEGEQPLEFLTSTGALLIYRRARALPISRIAYEIEVIADPRAARARIHETGFDPATTVILDREPPCDVKAIAQANSIVRIVEHRPGYWLIDAESEAPGLLVLSENAYPGWRVTVDGEEAEPLTAYTVLRAVCVPAGRHHVAWFFDPLSLKIGAAVTLPAAMVSGAAGWAVLRRNKQGSPPDQSDQET